LSVYLWTAAAEWATLAAGVLFYRLAARSLPADDFSEYLISRRAVTLLLPVVLLGLDTALPRNLAAVEEREAQSEAGRLFLAGLLCWCAACGLAAAVLLPFSSGFGTLFFGDPRLSGRIPPVCLLLTGTGLMTLCQGFFQGAGRMREGNLFQVAHYGIMPLAVLSLSGPDAGAVLLGLGIGSLSLSLSALAIILRSTRPGKERLRESSGRLLRQGLPRAPGAFLLMGLLSAPVFILTHREGLPAGGAAAFGMALLTLFSSLLYPIRVIMLPEASAWLARGEYPALRRRSMQVLSVAGPLVLALTALIETWMPELVGLLLGGAYPGAAAPARVIALGTMPLAFFSAFRSILDAGEESARSTRVLAEAFLTFALAAGACAALNLPGDSFLWLFVGSLYLLAIRTGVLCWKILDGFPEGAGNPPRRPLPAA
jgi:O-antigen/teichoic acid export membrane protein